MAGIISYGAYVPICRLSREIIGKEWGTSGSKGEKAVANYDEDSLTMAVEAVIDCLKGFDAKQVDALYFASTTPPYHEKQSASIIAAVVDMRPETYTADFANSLRSVGNAIKAALDAIESGSAKQVLVVAADSRMPAPDSEFEGSLGDGAAAILLGKSDTVVNIEGNYSVYSDFLDIWRRDKDHYPQMWEDRFATNGFTRVVKEAASGLLKKYQLTPKNFSKLVCNAFNARRLNEVAGVLGFDTKTQLVGSLFDTVGDTGSGFSLMMLVAALEQAKDGDKILFLSYGDGCDAWILNVTQIGKPSTRRGVKNLLASKRMLPSYGKYMHFRNMLEWQIERRPPDRTSLTALERDRRWILPLMALKCKSCGGIQYPVMGRGRICTWCQVKDNFGEIKISDKKGTLFTYSMDERAMEAELPNVLCVIDLEGGGRFFGQMTDRDPAKIEVGMTVELTFRKIQEGSGIYSYFWKVRPIRC